METKPFRITFWGVYVLLMVGLMFLFGQEPTIKKIGDLGQITPIEPAEIPISVTKIYMQHTADFQNYAVGDLFTEFMNTEPVGVITTEQYPMYAGMKSLWKTNQSGYMKYYRFRDIKLTGCTIQYSETFRLNEVSSSYAYFTWSGMAADTEAYPNIQLKTVSGRFVVYIRQNSISDPIAILDCGPRDTFVHKVTVICTKKYLFQIHSRIGLLIHQDLT